jgi:UDP-GlcNAc:undecaprenyl-phosphate/decaprenyl-phosphate GlcNAc-1-phosphate transferase
LNDLQSHYPSFIFVNVLLATILSLALGWPAIRMAQRMGLMDVPGTLPHKKHGMPMPYAGGLTLISTLAICGILFNPDMVMELWRVFIPALFIFAIGLWDDFKRLPARIKLVGQLVAAVMLIALGTSVQIIPAQFLGLPGQTNIAVNWIITLFWVVGITNAFNFIDSMDGLAVGVSGIAIAFLILVTLGSSQTSLLQLLTLMIGTCVGLFFYNMTPARFFLGDSGAQSLGFLLAAIGILYTPVRYPQASSWFLPILILGVPIFDTSLVVLSRWRRGLPVYRAGHDHTYHRLTAAGLDSTRAVAVMHIAAIVLGCVAFIALNLEPLYSNLLFGLVLVTGLAAFLFLDRKNG